MTVPFAQAVTRRSIAGSSHVAGRWVDGPPTDTTIQASIQPAGMQELERLDEGDRTKGAINIWSETELVAADERSGKRGDQVKWQDEWWEVKKCDPWIDGHYSSSDLSHYPCLAVRLDR